MCAENTKRRTIEIGDGGDRPASTGRMALRILRAVFEEFPSDAVREAKAKNGKIRLKRTKVDFSKG
jgi:hypothetical protein